jgi:hypothetical protein
MSRSHIVPLMLFTALALSQAPVVGQQTPAAVSSAAIVAAPLGADEVVARMMSFDRNRDGKIEPSELPDRMQNLFGRGDTGRDGTLDDAEIRRLATAPTVSMTLAGGRAQPGGYTFGDQAGVFSTRTHIDGALNDLMLESPAREQAQEIVRKFEEDLEFTAKADLVKQMEPLMTADQLTAFRTMVERQTTVGPLTAPGVSENARVFFFGMDLGRRVEAFGLPPAQGREAAAAIERFNARLRTDDESRAALLKQLRRVLTAEERDNFRAALERRPLVKANTMISFPAGVVMPGQDFRAVEKRLLLLDSTVNSPVVVR